MLLLPASVELSGHDVQLRRMGAGDEAAVVAFLEVPDIRALMPTDATGPTAARELIARSDAGWVAGRLAHFAIVSAGAVTGEVSLTTYEDGWRGSVGYALLPEHRGKGLATQAVRLVTSWAFRTLPALVRLELWVVPENAPSIAVARRAGYVEEGVMRARWRHRGTCRDVLVLSRVRTDGDTA
jgi:RimJ/RimL family protein N-acetyltransferase